MRKICFAASSGGHLEEIYRLKEIAEGNDTCLVTEYHSTVNNFCDRLYMVRHINRKERFFLLHYAWMHYRAFNIIRKERPEIIISTGALATYPLCVIGKRFGAKIIYIESFARVEGLSLTGKLMKPIADLYIVQWEDLLQYVDGAEFATVF